MDNKYMNKYEEKSRLLLSVNGEIFYILWAKKVASITFDVMICYVYFRQSERTRQSGH